MAARTAPHRSASPHRSGGSVLGLGAVVAAVLTLSACVVPHPPPPPPPPPSMWDANPGELIEVTSRYGVGLGTKVSIDADQLALTGNTLLIADGSSRSLRSLDLATGQLTERTAIPDGAVDLAANAAGTAWFRDPTKSELPAHTTMVEVSPSGAMSNPTSCDSGMDVNYAAVAAHGSIVVSTHINSTGSDIRVLSDGQCSIYHDAPFLYRPSGIAIADDGTIYISDLVDPGPGGPVDVVYALSPPDTWGASGGTFTRIAGGNPSGTPVGDGGPASASFLWTVQSVQAVGDDLYIAEFDRVRRIDSTGTITTVIGVGSSVSLGSSAITDMVVRDDGTVFLAMSTTIGTGKVVSIPPGGPVTRIAGNLLSSYSGDGGPSVNAQLGTVGDVALLPDRSVVVADTQNNRIRHISSTTGTITTIAGTGGWSNSGDGGPATSAQLSAPQGIAVDPQGRVLFSTSNRVRRFTPGGTIELVAGNGYNGYTGDGGDAKLARLSGPQGIAVVADGTIYIADQHNHRIRMVSTTGIITTFAGTGTAAFGGDGGPATAASFHRPTDVELDSTGAVLIADPGNLRVRRVSGGVITTVAGNGGWSPEGLGGPATDAAIPNPRRIAAVGTGFVIGEGAPWVWHASDFGDRIVYVRQDGTVHHVASSSIGGMAWDTDGGLFYTDNWPRRQLLKLGYEPT